MSNRFGVGVQDYLPATDLAGGGEGADEHQERRTGKVKICNERIHDAKIMWRMDEHPRGSRISVDRRRGVGLRGHGGKSGESFQRAKRGRPDGNDATLIAFGFINQAGGFCGNGKALSVHFVR